MFIEKLTPLILTYNEAPNIGRALKRLDWARDIVVVDSLSHDDTLKIVADFPQARVFQRKFDTHVNQWSFGMQETGIATDWVLALDADYLLTPELVEELKGLDPGQDVCGYRARFIYCVNGKPLKGSAYPPVTVLYRRDSARYIQDGHTQRVEIRGEVSDLSSPILHDDRKSLSHWVWSQSRYTKLEAEKIKRTGFRELNLVDRIRKARLFAPFLMLLYCLFVKGVILDGRAGIYYALQRTFAELMLSLYLFEHDLSIKDARHEAGKSCDEVLGLKSASRPNVIGDS
jgi:glycosyltransferase involved in cell wall biosynthesis